MGFDYYYLIINDGIWEKKCVILISSSLKHYQHNCSTWVQHLLMRTIWNMKTTPSLKLETKSINKEHIPEQITLITFTKVTWYRWILSHWKRLCFSWLSHFLNNSCTDSKKINEILDLTLKRNWEYTEKKSS